MFKRLSYDEWQAMAPIIAFLLTFAVFLFQVVRAIAIKRHQSDRLARLPLDEHKEVPGNPTDATTATPCSPRKP